MIPELQINMLSKKMIYRFLKQLPNPLPKEGCWFWTGKFDNGYGYVAADKEKQRANRISFVYYKHKIPAGFMVRHTCATPACVAPYHLILGTNRDNQLDRIYPPIGGNWLFER